MQKAQNNASEEFSFIDHSHIVMASTELVRNFSVARRKVQLEDMFGVGFDAAKELVIGEDRRHCLLLSVLTLCLGTS